MEVAAGSVSFVAVAFSTFQSCVQAFEFFYTAQHIGADGDLFYSKLQWEQYRLVQWGSKAGLGDSTSRNQQLNWSLAYMLLQQMETLMTSAEKLKSKYRLDVVEEEVNELERQTAAGEPPKGLGQFIARLKPEIYTLRGQIIQNNNNTLKRLRWATAGKEQANSVISEISDLNRKLHQLLDSLEQERRTTVDAVLLRDIISRSSTASEVEQIQAILEPSRTASNQAIKASATLKQIRLVIGADQRSDEVKTPKSDKLMHSMPTITKLKHRKLVSYTSDVPMRYKSIEFARYNQKAVLVEWKVAEGPMC